MKINNGGANEGLQSIVLFPFDDYSIPFQHGLKLELQGNNAGTNRNPVLPLGEAGAHDSKWIAFYGTVLRVGKEFWMWYLAQGPEVEWHQRACLAVSRDGRTWRKPNLGLVEYNGSTNNNILDLGEDIHIQACIVFYEPDEPDHNKRFKMAFESTKYRSRLAVAYSADGIQWTPSLNNPVGGWFEMGGGTKLGACFYLAGQGGNHGRGLRQLVTTVSYDFENWSSATCSGLRRGKYLSTSPQQGKNAGEQVHLGAALWNRGNIIIGLYGKWNGHHTSDRRMLTMDLGLAISNDGLHYKEPIPDFPMVAAAEFNWNSKSNNSLAFKFPALMQGQGFENIGTETLFWFSSWPEEASDGVRLASWDRDRLGYFTATGVGNWSYSKGSTSHFISAPIDLEGKATKLAMNVDGLNPHSHLTVEIQDLEFKPIPGFQANCCQIIEESGLHQPVTWGNQEVIGSFNGLIRIRVNFHGIRPEDIRLYAVYLEHL